MSQRYSQFVMNIVSASGLLALGDFCAQKFYEKQIPIDEKRLLAGAATGVAMGVEAHVWYSFLDRTILRSTWRNVFKKVVLDQTIAAPIYTTTYIVGTSILEGRCSMNELKNDTKENFIPLYIADCAVFIPVQIFNFKYVSAYYRVPFMFFISFIFNIFLSAYKHAHEK